MNTLQIENQWKKIEIIDENGLSYLRIDGKCLPELCIAVNKHNHRCLMLKLSKDYKTSFYGEEKENIITSYSSNGHYILLELLDSYYNTLFNDLIISLYYKIKDIPVPSESTNTFISTINKWASFLENSKNSKLSKEIIKGLYGELVVLKDYLSEANIQSVNEILKAWTGPYDANNDFVFENLNIEVKTKNTASSLVKISSAFQLDDEPGKSLKLLVVSVDSGNNSIETIKIIFNKIRNIILELNGDLSILTDALSQKSLFPSNLKDYDDFKFKPKSLKVYDCTSVIDNEGFPRIKDSDIPDQLKSVSYNINLHELEKFIINIKEY